MENLSFLVSQEGKRFMSFACVCGVHTHVYSCLHMCGNVSVQCSCMCVYVDGEATGRCWKLLWLLWTLLTYTVFPWAWRWSIPLTRLSSQLLWDPVPQSWGYRWDTWAALTLRVSYGVTHCFSHSHSCMKLFIHWVLSLVWGKFF